MKKIIKTIIVITLLTIPQVKAITSDQVIYGEEKTVTEALDELNVCSTSGNATSDSILNGKTAYVQGKLVTGTMRNASIKQVGEAGLNSSYPGIPVIYASKLQLNTTTDGTAIFSMSPAPGYYTTGSSYASATQEDVAKVIGLTGDKMVSGTTILGVSGTIPTLTTAAYNNASNTVAYANATTSSFGAYSYNDTTKYLYLGIPANTYTGNNKFVRVSESEMAKALPNKTAATYTPGTSNQTISAGQWLSGAQTIKGDANLKAENIKCGVTIFGVKGTKDCAPSTLLSGLYTTAKIGDYVQMTPTSTSYSIPTSLTGYTSAQTINPSELKLWRIIRFNDDGTIDMVSEYVSSTAVYFKGQTGYKNFVGALNTIAAQYANSNYTIATRHMGYNGQTATITATLTQATCGTSSTSNNSKETSGCGDVSYQVDTNLVRSVYGNLKANKVNATSTATSYWLASRRYLYIGPNEFTFFSLYVFMDSGGAMVNNNGLYYYLSDGWSDGGTGSYAIRPVVTLKSGVTATSGSGTKANPWKLT